LQFHTYITKKLTTVARTEYKTIDQYQIPNNINLPVELIKRIVEFRKKENDADNKK